MSDFEPVYHDAAEVQRVKAQVNDLVDAPWHLKTEALARRGWIAVPAEKARHLTEAEARALARTLREDGLEHCYAFATEQTGIHTSVYRVEASVAGLLKFSGECAGLNFIVVPADVSCAVLCTTEDYNVYAGTADFLRRALGTDIDAARTSFLEYASDEWWEGRLLEVAQRYGATGT